MPLFLARLESPALKFYAHSCRPEFGHKSSTMVRVISVHHFSGQDVSSVPRPAAACAAGPHTLVVAAADDQTLLVKDLRRGSTQPVSHSFQVSFVTF